MELKTVLNNKNCEGGIYRSDVARWLKTKLDYNDVRDLINELQEMRERKMQAFKD